MTKEEREHITSSTSYNMTKRVAELMDNYYIDPIAGFVIPGVGDIATQVLSLPALYVAMVKVKSMTLGLAVVYNMIVDFIVGLLPIVGDIADIFWRSHIRNYELIEGYINDDKEVVNDVKNKAIMTVLLIIIICLVVYICVSVLGWFVNGLGNLFG